MPWDEDLTGVAREIAQCDARRIRVVAGPGTGKTFAMMRRVARLLEEGTPAERILVCTFTRTAAADLRDELARLGTAGCETVQAGTLHSYCFRLLARDRVLQATGRTPRTLLSFETETMLRDLSQSLDQGIRECRDRLKALAAAWARLQTDEPGWCEEPDDQAFRDAMLRWLRFHRAMLVGELVPEALAYLRLNPLSCESGNYDHVMVDEYQDLNRADQELIGLISANCDLAVVGDEDQSIYCGLRHAHPEGISVFHEAHPDTRDFTLGECRRCPISVVTLANRMISRNDDRAQRQLSCREENWNGQVHVVQWPDMQDEAQGIADFVHHAVTSGRAPAGHVLILAPRREFGYAVRDLLNDLGTPAHSFYQEEAFDATEAQEAFALLTLLADHNDRAALRCWCGFGSPSLRGGEWSRLRSHCYREEEAPWDALNRLAAGDLRLRYTTGIADRFGLLQERLQELTGQQGPEMVNALFPEACEWATVVREMALEDTAEEPDPAEEAQLTACGLHKRLRAHITQPELPNDVDYVRVMSLQKSKGLTADLVVMQGSIQGLTPYLPTGTAEEDRPSFVQEGRRLFYVAMTRTTDTLVISYPALLPDYLAHRWRVPSQYAGGDRRRVGQSQFVGELQGPGFPGVITGDQFLRRVGVIA